MDILKLESNSEATLTIATNRNSISTEKAISTFNGTRLRKKVVVVGDGGCGKTCLLQVQSGESFSTEYIPTIFDNYISTIQLSTKLRVELSLWDTAGQEDYDRLRPLSYPDTDVIVLVYDVADWNSFDNLSARWIPEIKHFLPHTPIVLVGTKADLRADRGAKIIGGSRFVTMEEGLELSKKIGASKYFECSAKSGEGVSDVFDYAAKVCVGKGKFRKREKCMIL